MNITFPNHEPNMDTILDLQKEVAMLRQCNEGLVASEQTMRVEANALRAEVNKVNGWREELRSKLRLAQEERDELKFKYEEAFARNIEATRMLSEQSMKLGRVREALKTIDSFVNWRMSPDGEMNHIVDNRSMKAMREETKQALSELDGGAK